MIRGEDEAEDELDDEVRLRPPLLYNIHPGAAESEENQPETEPDEKCQGGFSDEEMLPARCGL